MKIVVCVKGVPDTEASISVGGDGKHISTDGFEYVISPYDEMAVEEALRIKEAKGDGEVVILSLGPDYATGIIRKALAMGADRGLHVKTDAELDPFSIAKSLAEEIKTVQPDLVFFGKQAVDFDNSQVHIMTAHLLDMPIVTAVTKLELGEGNATARREIEGGVEVYETTLPACFSAQKGLNEPRYPSLKGIMKAKKKPLDEKEPVATGNCFDIQGMSYPPKRQGGKIVGEGAEAVPELLRLLREEAKVL